MDALEMACRYWEHLIHPELQLAELIGLKSSLHPVMVTDAKALYDSFHRDTINNAAVDKRTSLEVRVTKEQLTALGGNFRWVSSERQFADGLTKESARQLLADRLRYGKIKLVWDPTYTAAKRKTVEERNRNMEEHAVTRHEHEEIPTEEINVVRSNEVIKYVDIAQNVKVSENVIARPSHVGHPNFLDYLNGFHNFTHYLNGFNYFLHYHFGMVILLLSLLALEWMPGAEASLLEDNQCPLEEPPLEDMMSSWEIFDFVAIEGFMLWNALIIAVSYKFGQRDDIKKGEEAAEMAEILHKQVEESLQDQHLKMQKCAKEKHDAAHQYMRALSLATGEAESLGELVLEAVKICHRAQRELEQLSAFHPMYKRLWIAKHGTVWHQVEDCHHLQNCSASNVVERVPCSTCACAPQTPFIRNQDGETLLDELRSFVRLVLERDDHPS